MPKPRKVKTKAPQANGDLRIDATPEELAQALLRGRAGPRPEAKRKRLASANASV